MTLLPFPANTFAIWPLNMGKSTPERIVRGKVQKHIGLCFENILPLKLFAGLETLAGFDTVFSMLNITNPVNANIFR